tara:strand:+ start:817 stop:1314 length:498 start_codon:yes stop_codon:yes gene_type:complete
MILDNLQNPGITSQGQRWSFFTDGVMGGLSKGKAEITEINNVACYRMTGNVTTENNGGFIQIRTPINPEIDAANHDGIYLKIYGNNKKYSLHIRTPFTLAPWQYYFYKFEAKNNWMEIKVPFNKFEKSNFYQPKKLPNQKLKTIGLVAGFDNFKADVCLAEIGFY